MKQPSRSSPPPRIRAKQRRRAAGAPQPAPRTAVFLDRDGTIGEEMGYLNHLRRFHLYPFAARAIRRLNRRGIPVIVVTNQSGVARGFFPEALVRRVHRLLQKRLRAAGARLAGIYYCPHQKSDHCACRKPKTGMLRQAAREHALRLAGSWIVSDRYSDLRMAPRVRARSILVKTGYGRGDYQWHRKTWPRQPDRVVEDLAAAVNVILRSRR
jgi:D-glycero-D-manno-heptose 1,7-bisphosphate phosphatase